MDLNKLKIFYYAAKSGSFTNNDLHLSPSVISRHISDLELRHKTKLFYRHPRQLVLTPQGQALYEAAQKIMDEVERAKSKMFECSNEAQGLLTIITPTAWTSVIFVRYASEFMKRYPKMRLNIISDDKNPEAHLQDYDVAILPYMPDASHLRVEKLTTFNLALYASPCYLDKHGTPQCLQDLDNHQLIAYADRDRFIGNVNWHLTAGCEAGETREPYLRVNNLFYAAEEGLGIAPLVEENHRVGRSNLVRVLPDIPGTAIDAYYVYPEHMREAKPIKIFGEYLKELVFQNPNELDMAS
jgi:DNA-binding transcriptional LysR family regulator